MSAKIIELKDKVGDVIYPVTRASASYLANGVDTVERVLNDMQDQNTQISFPQNQVVKQMASGNTVTTQFLENQIIETTVNSDSIVLKVKTTTFNADGTITISVDGDEEGE